MAGSETRQRQKMMTIRLTEDEHDLLRERAASAGLSLGGYVRKTALGKAGIRTRRQPTAPRDELRRLKAELNRIGNNLNQMAHGVNMGNDPKIERLEASLTELQNMNALIRHALGFRDDENDLCPSEGAGEGGDSHGD